jgi:hypothetical protein
MILSGKEINHFIVIIKLCTGGLACYIMHGASAISAVVLSMKHFLLHESIAKGKTEMKNK